MGHKLEAGQDHFWNTSLPIPLSRTICCERFIKTFKEEFAWTRNFKSIEHARFALRAWIHAYNTQRPHQALNFKTPNQHYQARCKAA